VTTTETRCLRRAVVLLLALYAGLGAVLPATSQTTEYIVVSWNDLGMHCMNKDHNTLSILPPYNTLYAQVIARGDVANLPQVVIDNLTLEYSVPGNTYSAGKTDFWDYVFHIFGVNLPPDVGLTGNGLTGAFDPHTDHFVAEGIPLTPFTDAAPTVEDPYQQALVIARDQFGVEVARSEPVIPVSTEMSCVSASCHVSEAAIVYGHELESAYDPADQPIFCAGCHSSPALGTPFDPEAHYLSYRIHKRHEFIDEAIPGLAGCQKCHPGPQAQCLRGTMATDFGMICQDCHGDMNQMHTSIETGRVPWVDEPSCRECHTATYGEPVGQLFRNSQGHGGVYCSACHGSPHAIFPSREARDNANNVDLQGHAGILSDCTVCHGTLPSGAGPHGLTASGVVEDELLGKAAKLAAYPSPFRPGQTCVFEARLVDPTDGGRMLVFDAAGRTVRLLRPEVFGDLVRASWDGTDGLGRTSASGVYFVQWRGGQAQAAAKVVLMD